MPSAHRGQVKEVLRVPKRKLDINALGWSEDKLGNNAAVCCPVCGKVFIVSTAIRKGKRECPVCHQSSAEITPADLTIQWPDALETPIVLTREEVIAGNRLEDFISLVKEGGAVTKASIEAQLPKAQRIAVIERGGAFVAVAAKKQPMEDYAKSVSAHSGYDLCADIPELGYVAVSRECRGQRLAGKVVRRILFEFGDGDVFATTSSARMKSVLAGCGFRWVGREWESKRTGEKVSLWIRTALSERSGGGSGRLVRERSQHMEGPGGVEPPT